jgi:formylglycine-generating enzyme required for sulfatase activity
MGCSADDSECRDDEKPAHTVKITSGLWIGQTEVTQAAYQRVMADNPSYFRGEQFPVENVSWNQANAYCDKTGMRLPTEAEWEYAARATTKRPRYGELDAIAWYEGNSGKTTHEVRQKQANGWNLYDMLGNAAEWVGDWYDPKYYQQSPSQDPKGPQTGQYRVLRGGAWGLIPIVLRAAVRFRGDPDSRTSSIGFRCVQEEPL